MEYIIKLTDDEISQIHSWRDAYLDRYMDDADEESDVWKKITLQRSEQDKLAGKK